MLKRNQKYLNFFNAIIELLLFFLSYLVATFIRFRVFYNPHVGIGLNMLWNKVHIQGALFFSLFMCILYYMWHMYSRVRTYALSKEINRVWQLNFIIILIVSTFFYFTRIVEFSRLTLLIFYFVVSLIISLKRITVRKLLEHLRKNGYNLRHILLIGSGKLANQYVDEINKNTQYGFNIKGYVANEDSIEENLVGLKRYCNYNNLNEFLHKNNKSIDSVVIALDSKEAFYTDKVLNSCEKYGIPSSMIPFFHKHFPANPTIDNIGSVKLLNIMASPLDDIVKASCKRIFDILFSLFIIIILSPLLLITSILIKLTSKGPIVYKQERIGKARKSFNMYKFRSMKINNSESYAWSKQKDDRRTAIGRIIRKLSIDELPQFFNVLKGDMSVVGPRPEIPFYVEKFTEEIPMYMLKHQVRPGITGLAQIHGYRGDTSIEKRIELDLEYIENWTIKMDIYIILKTIFGGMINDEK